MSSRLTRRISVPSSMVPSLLGARLPGARGGHDRAGAASRRPSRDGVLVRAPAARPGLPAGRPKDGTAPAKVALEGLQVGLVQGPEHLVDTLALLLDEAVDAFEGGGAGG